MTRFIVKICIFLLPIALVLAPPAAVILLSREKYSNESVIRIQTAHPEALVAKKFIDNDTSGRLFKKALIKDKKPELITIGSSRSMTFRKELFSNPDRFVNAAFGRFDIYQFEHFLASLPEDTSVKVVLVGLDQNLFRSDFAPYAPPPEETLETLGEHIVEFVSYDWRMIYYDSLVRKLFTFRDVLARSLHTNDIGLAALIEKEGFRGDGSYNYRVELENPQRKQLYGDELAQKLALFKEDRGAFEYATSTSAAALASLDRVLALAKARHIQVIGFLTPYAPELYTEMLSVDDRYREMVFELPRVIRAVFIKHGFETYDFSNAKILGANDGEFINTTHVTDKFDLRELLYMANRSQVLRPYVDIKKAESLIANTPQDFLPLDASPK